MGYKALEDGRLNFYVKDTGQGIAEEQLQNLFNRFVKVNDYVEGIGLGLAICKGLVTKMGGSIRVVIATRGRFHFFVYPAFTRRMRIYFYL